MKSELTWICSPWCSQEENIKDPTWCRNKHPLTFLGLQRNRLPDVHGRREKINSETYVKIPTRLRRRIEHVSRENKLMRLRSNNGTPHTIAVTSVMIENIKFKAVPDPPQSGFGTVWLLALCSCQEASKGNSLYMWWRRWRCCRKMVSRAFGTTLQLQGRKKVISAGSNESKEETAWKRQLWKQSAHSEIYLYFVSFR